MFDLEKLREKREEILKAELATWLHDVGKCADAFLQLNGTGFYAQNCSGNPWVNPHKAVFSPSELQNLSYWNSLSPQRGQCARLEEANHSTALWKTLRRLSIQFPLFNILFKDRGSVSLKELVLWGRPLVSDRYNNFKQSIGSDLTYLAGILGRSHSAAHMEKEEKADGGQAEGYASPFGLYVKDFSNLDNKLSEIIRASQSFLSDRTNFLLIFRQKAQTAPGDTRRPINEVTLWDWSSIVAALYKAEIARCVLKGGERREPKDIQWRLLSIRTDGLSYLLSASSIPDMLARKEILQDAWNKVQKLLEEDYPLGLEVYRDENGSVFVVPDLNVLGLTNSTGNNKTLCEYILEAFQSGTVRDDPCLAVNGEIVPVFYLDEDPWDGQSKLPPIGEHLKRIPTLQSDPKWVAGQWCNLPKEAERCTVCGLRPQGPSKKSRDRKMCDVCEQRREDRAKEWATQKLNTTVWIDEVADENGRIALVVGKFDLEHWLSGDLVRSLAVREPNDKNGHHWKDISKNPSFARLRRIWETTREFWEQVRDKVVCETVREKKGRIFVKGDIQSNSLGPYHAYEVEIKGNRIAVLWVPPDTKDEQDEPLKFRGGFWVIENPEYFKNRFHIELESELKNKNLLEIWEPSEYGGKREKATDLQVSEVLSENTPEFTPLIPILAEPQVFMAIVPADKAFEIVKAIKTKYEREMGKVRNRLPLHIGVVYAYRKMPLRAIVDAGRRILEFNMNRFRDLINEWKVVDDVVKQKTLLPDDKKELAQNNAHFNEWYILHLTNEKWDKALKWYVPAVMGDGTTPDNWYPYVFVRSKNKPVSCSRCYEVEKNPWSADDRWVVHVEELKKDDRVYFTPATFDFEFLDSNARRFEIAYDDNGKRRNSLTKPYLLDEIEVLDKIWKFLTQKQNGKPRLSTTQIFVLREMIETKREEWFENLHDSLVDKNFEKFCHDLFANAQWQWDKPDKSKLQWLADMAVRGYFTDAVYLFHHVMKEKPEGEE